MVDLDLKVDSAQLSQSGSLSWLQAEDGDATRLAGPDQLQTRSGAAQQPSETQPAQRAQQPQQAQQAQQAKQSWQTQLAQQSQQPQQAQPAQQFQLAQHAQQSQQAQQAQQEAQPAAQPVLALLNSGLPPIVLGTFQGDMQRARIILEAAGFLTPFDISSSLLPTALQSGLSNQLAAHDVHAEHAEPGGQQAGAAGMQEAGLRSEDEEAAVQQALSLSKSASPSAFEQGKQMMHLR